MREAVEVGVLRVGQRVITDTSRTATILELSNDMARVMFDNGLEDWWALSTLERVRPDDLFNKAR